MLNPEAPVCDVALPKPLAGTTAEMAFVRGREGPVEIGDRDAGFACDHERPRQGQWLHPHALAVRPMSNTAYREFIRGGGHRTPALRLAGGGSVQDATGSPRWTGSTTCTASSTWAAGA